MFGGIDPRAMTVLRMQLYGIIADSTVADQDRIGRSDEAAFRAVTLAHRTTAMTADIHLLVLAHMAVVPGDPYRSSRLDMIKLDWNCCYHSSKLDQTIAKRSHKSDPVTIDQIGPGRDVGAIQHDGVGNRNKLALVH